MNRSDEDRPEAPYRLLVGAWWCLGICVATLVAGVVFDQFPVYHPPWVRVATACIMFIASGLAFLLSLGYLASSFKRHIRVAQGVLALLATGFLALQSLVWVVFAGPLTHSETMLQSGEMTGVVVEREIGKPVANALVIAKWNGAWQGFYGGGRVCVRAAVITADEVGRFRIPAWTMPVEDVERLTIELAAYRSGYEVLDRPRAGEERTTFLGIPLGKIRLPEKEFRIEMGHAKGDATLRAGYLLGFLPTLKCEGAGSVAALAPLHLAVREEVAGMPAEVRDHRDDAYVPTLLEEIDHTYLHRSVALPPPRPFETKRETSTIMAPQAR